MKGPWSLCETVFCGNMYLTETSSLECCTVYEARQVGLISAGN